MKQGLNCSQGYINRKCKNKDIDVFPLSKKQTFRIAEYLPRPSIPDRASDILHITSALARIIEKRTAQVADRKWRKLGEE
jgi:hypothetical protein